MFLSNKHTRLMVGVVKGASKTLGLLASLYIFIISLSFLSTGFKITGGRNIGVFFESSALLSNPVVGVMLGVLVTVMVQSSSTSTSILVGLVGAGAPVSRVIPMVLGANIGTSVTNTVVAITQGVGDRESFRRAFSCATVHDMFNWLSVILFTTVETQTAYLETVTQWMVTRMETSNTTVSSPDLLKRLTSPVIKLVVQLDSGVLEGWARNTSNATSLLKEGCSDGEGCSYLLAYLGGEGAGWSDLALGLGLVGLALVLMVGGLLSIVKVLNSVLGGEVMGMVQKMINSDLPCMPWLTGYLAMLVGAVLTFLLQSSSVFTSTLTPLAGAGLVTLERAYPLTLGSNIGTTTTSILASLATDGARRKPALQIALVHLVFNLSGILVFYCIPAMRWPIHLARRLGDITASYPWFASLYLVMMFLLLPLAVFLLSLLGPLPITITTSLIFLLVCMVFIISTLQTHLPHLLPSLLRDWTFLPLPLRSLAPYDRLISRLCTCRRHLITSEDEETGLSKEAQEPLISTKKDAQLSLFRPIIKKSSTAPLVQELESVLLSGRRGTVSLPEELQQSLCPMSDVEGPRLEEKGLPCPQFEGQGLSCPLPEGQGLSCHVEEVSCSVPEVLQCSSNILSEVVRHTRTLADLEETCDKR